MRRMLAIVFLAAISMAALAGSSVLVKDGSNMAPAIAYKFGSPAQVEARSSNLPPAGSRDPLTLDEVIISEDFEAYDEGTLPPGWTQVSQDAGTSPVFDGGPSEWQVLGHQGYPGHNESVKSVANAYNSGGAPNNDWLILPQQTLTGEITLSYYAVSQDPDYLESYEVRVSTTGNLPADFTNLVQSITDVPGTWTPYVHDLSAFAGQPIYIAFHYISVDEFVLKIDDLLLETGEVTPRGALGGVVRASGTNQPIADATVSLLGTAFQTTTDAAGEYIFTGLPVAAYHVSFSKFGYATLVDSNNAVTEGDTVIVDALLTPVTAVISEDFEAYDEGTLPPGWTQVSQDAGTSPVFDGGPSEWQVLGHQGYPGHNESIKSVANAYNSGGTPNNDWLILPQQTLTGAITLTYFAVSQDPEYLESYEVRVSTTGNLPANFTNLIESVTDVPGDWTEYSHDLSAFADQPIYIAFHYISADEFVLKIDDLVLSGTNVDAIGDNPASATEFAFYGNYPNPFNAQTQFSFNLDRTGLVQLVLYNVIGQEVAQLVNGTLNAGAHVVPFNASALPTGVYLARLTAGTQSLTHKVLLLK